jgi:hypothetical protein
LDSKAMLVMLVCKVLADHKVIPVHKAAKARRVISGHKELAERKARKETADHKATMARKVFLEPKVHKGTPAVLGRKAPAVLKGKLVHPVHKATLEPKAVLVRKAW